MIPKSLLNVAAGTLFVRLSAAFICVPKQFKFV